METRTDKSQFEVGHVQIDKQNSDAPLTAPDDLKALSVGFRDKAIHEILEMASHLLSAGKEIGDTATLFIQSLEVGKGASIDVLVRAHYDLAQRVLPARPVGITSLADERYSSGLLLIFGPTPGVRRLSLGSFLFGATFLLATLSPQADDLMRNETIFSASGERLALWHIILLSASGLGASFGVLFGVWNDIVRRQFDPLSESAHWMRIGLGLISGILISEILKVDPAAVKAVTLVPLDLSAITLALLGGFSVSFLHRGLTRFLLGRDKPHVVIE